MLFQRKYKLSIPEPCREDWNKMQPVDRGRFCESCSKVVIDFSHMSEREIAVFLKSQPKNACGRFRQQQLNKSYTTGMDMTIPAHKRVIRYAISAFLIGGAAKQVKSQSQDSVIVQADSVSKDSSALVSTIDPVDSVNCIEDTGQLTLTTDPVFTPDEISVKVEEWQVFYPGEIIVAGGIGISPEFVLFPQMPIPLLDTIGRICGKIRNSIRGSQVAVGNKTEKVPVQEPSQKTEAIMPSVFTWRGKKREANGRQS